MINQEEINKINNCDNINFSKNINTFTHNSSNTLTNFINLLNSLLSNLNLLEFYNSDNSKNNQNNLTLFIPFILFVFFYFTVKYIFGESFKDFIIISIMFLSLSYIIKLSNQIEKMNFKLDKVLKEKEN